MTRRFFHKHYGPDMGQKVKVQQSIGKASLGRGRRVFVTTASVGRGGASSSLRPPSTFLSPLRRLGELSGLKLLGQLEDFFPRSGHRSPRSGVGRVERRRSRGKGACPKERFESHTSAQRSLPSDRPRAGTIFLMSSHYKGASVGDSATCRRDGLLGRRCGPIASLNFSYPESET